MSSLPYVSLGARLLRETRDLTKYIRPGAGKRLLEWEEQRWGINGRLPEHYLEYHRTWKKGPQVGGREESREERWLDCGGFKGGF